MAQKSKLTLIIDGNWLLMSRLFVLHNRFSSDTEMINDLKLLMIKSINVVLRTFPDIDNILFVSDGGSWRNHLEIPNCLKGTEYKGNREQDEAYDWDLIFKGYNDFISELTETGINAYFEHGVEGDDWCWYWSRRLNADGTNVIIWSKDKDLTQLVQTDNNKCFTICWNKEGGVTMQNKEEDDMDFFFNNEFNINEKILNDILVKTSVNRINPNSVVIDKVFRGDAGDNIMPVVKRKSNTSEKTFRISEKELDFNINLYNRHEVLNYFNNLLAQKKYIGKVDKSIDDIMEHFDYNVKLVALTESSYPEEILSIMRKYTYNVNKDTTQITDKINADKNDVLNILEEI